MIAAAMTWPEAAVAIVGIIAAAVVLCVFLWVMAN
jgi:hypothetical protein